MKCNKPLPLRQKSQENHSRDHKQRVPDHVLPKLQDAESSENKDFWSITAVSPSWLHASASPESPSQLSSSGTKGTSRNSSKVAKNVFIRRGNTRPRSLARPSCNDGIYPRSRHGFHVKDQEKLLAFVHARLSRTNQGALKGFAQNLIDAVCPRKRFRYPYKRGKAPPYWPDFGNYQNGVHHKQKPDLVPLMVYLMRLYWSADDYDRFNDPKKDDSSKLKAGWSTFLQTVIMCDKGEREKLQCAESTASAVWAAMKDVVDVLSAEYDWLCERTDGMKWFEFDNVYTLELPEIIRDYPHLFFRERGQPTRVIEGSDNANVDSTTSDSSFAKDLTSDTPVSSADIKRRLSSGDGDSDSSSGSEHMPGASQFGDNESISSSSDMHVTIKTDAAVNDPYDFSNWLFDDVVPQPQSFTPETMYSQAQQGLQTCMGYDYMPHLSSCAPDGMSPGYMSQAVQSPYGIPCNPFNVAACNYYPTFMGPLSSDMPATFDCCGPPMSSQGQPRYQPDMLLGSSVPGSNMAAGQEWAMNQQHMAYYYAQMPSPSAEEFPYGPPTPHPSYSFGGQPLSFHESQTPRSFDTGNRRRVRKSH